MSDNFNKFIEEQTENTAKVIKWVFRKIAKLKYDEQYILNCDNLLLEKLLLELTPNSKKEISTNCYILGLYSRWLYNNGLYDNENLYLVSQSINKEILWRKAKVLAPKKFISNELYEETILNIETFEPYNSLYYSTLFSCIYEGIYCDDMSVLWNLRGSDIHDNIVTLRHNNGTVYDLKISHRLAENLKELSEIDVWERKARYGTIKINVSGEYVDSCFKIETRNNSSNNPDAYRNAYYGKLRKIVKEYVEYNLIPSQIFVSGIMHRIKIELKKYDVSLQYVFAELGKNYKHTQVIKNELARCHYNIDTFNFNNIVSGHIDVFSK